MEGTQRQARSAVVLRRGPKRLSQLARGLRWGCLRQMPPRAKIPTRFEEGCINYFKRRQQRNQRGYFDPKDQGPSGESLAHAPATSTRYSYGSNEQFVALLASALLAGEATIPSEHIIPVRVLKINS